MMVFINHWAQLVTWFKNDPAMVALAKRIGLP
jgi:hypothetical protein